MRFQTAIALALTVVAATAGCGKLAAGDDSGESGTTTDAGDEKPLRCTDGVFGAPMAIAELDTPDDEYGLRLTPDELSGIFQRRSSNAYATGIYLATRPVIGQPFATPVHQRIYGSFPSVRGDALEAFLEEPCSIGPSNYVAGLCQSSRASNADVFDEPAKGVLTLPGGPTPLQNGLRWGDGYVTSAATAYYFMAPSELDAGNPLLDAGADASPAYSVYREPIPPDVDSVLAVLTPTDSSIFVDHPIVTGDELTLYASEQTQSDPAPHVARATRASIDEPFGPLVPVHELDSADGEYPTWVSTDECRLYLARKVGGQWDAYVASRAP